ncbi:MAG: transglycosylase domain-containing protein [Kofleriaceae bacterium]|nr:transglycosylase domain-containing protein [Kofleriaceae bacterium]
MARRWASVRRGWARLRASPALTSRRWRWPRRMLIGLVGAWLVASVGWWGAVRVGDFPMHLLDRTAATSLVVVDADGGVLRQEATSAGLRERWVALEAIAPALIDATLASEDNDFFEHAGVDWSALARAGWLNLRERGVEFGGSTLTMQLVRLVAGTSRTWTGKARQMLLAARLERQLGKRAILEQYLNRVYYGHGAWGAEQAAQVYFGKPARALSVGEAALLAVVPRGPRFYDPFLQPERVERRRRHILGLMQRHGYLDASTRSLAERTPLVLARTRPAFRAPHFVDLVTERLPAALRRGATVRTTLDPALQRHLEVALRGHLDRVGGRHITQAGLVVLRNHDGAILALVGSADYDDHAASGVWSAATARLRPGSTLKPFIYAAALERGDTPATLASDVILAEDVGQFYSKDVRSHGFARYREALAGSYNLSAVHTLQRVGVGPALARMRAAGLGTLDRPDADYDWGLAIGHAEVRLLDLTAAFSLFGRGGRPITPRAIEQARAVDGTTWREPVVERPPVFSEEVSYLLFDMLSDPDARKPMFGDRVPMNLPFPVALKTGTTKAYTDLWAIGVTREYTVGVWAGNFDGSPTHQVMSSEGATPLLRAAYSAIAARFGDPTAPPRPAAIVGAEVCALSGQRPGPHCRHHKHELFVAGHVPTATCDWHQVVCGQPTVVYPPALAGWARHYRRTDTRVAARCGDEAGADAGAPLTLVVPLEGARFQLEPHRPARDQRPPLLAQPAGPDLRWSIDGQPADRWVPTLGPHRVEVARGQERRAVTILYE